MLVNIYFFIIRFYAIMHGTTIVQNKILSSICSCVFLCLANIYRPSLRKVWLGRPNPKPLQPFNFYLRSKRWNPFYSELYALQRINARFSIFIFIYLSKKLKFLTIDIIIIIIMIFLKSAFNTLLECQCNLFHLNMMDNEGLKWVWNFKNSTLWKCILIIFLLWKLI